MLVVTLPKHVHCSSMLLTGLPLRWRVTTFNIVVHSKKIDESKFLQVDTVAYLKRRLAECNARGAAILNLHEYQPSGVLNTKTKSENTDNCLQASADMHNSKLVKDPQHSSFPLVYMIVTGIRNAVYFAFLQVLN